MISSYKKNNNITVSIVSHGQFKLLLPLLENLRKQINLAKIILTINIPERIKKPSWLDDLPIIWIHNKSIKGFGNNHNAAFNYCETKYFFVLNPDIRIKEDILTDLILLKEKNKVNILGPKILDSYGNNSINCRKFPNIFYFLRKSLKSKEKEYFYNDNGSVLITDWIGGMFLIFSREDYIKLNGFDTDFFLYFEDVDICKRASNIGFTIGQSRNLEVTHEAQRQSHVNFKHFTYHLRSYLLYLKNTLFK